MLRCVFCGMCVEACPCDAIRMDTGWFTPPDDTREKLIFTIDMLLEK
jgi:NADH-quinone oxidoreductase subunit I